MASEIREIELKILIAGVFFTLLITAMGFGIAGVSAQDVPQLNTSDVGPDFIPDSPPELNDSIGGPPDYTRDVQNLTGEIQYNQTVVMLEFAIDSDTYQLEGEVIDDGSGTRQIQTRVRNLDTNEVTHEVNPYDLTVDQWIGGLQNTPDAQFSIEFRDNGDGTVDYRITRNPYGGDNIGIISGAIRQVSDAIAFIANSIIYLVELAIFIVQLVLGWIVKIVGIIVTLFLYLLSLVTFLFSVFTAIGTLHPVLNAIISIPLLAIGYVLAKIVMMIIDALPTT